MRKCRQCSVLLNGRKARVFCSRKCCGDFKRELANRTLHQRFEARTAKRPNGCIEWTGTMLADGYGVTRVLHHPTKAHRVAYLLFKGPIPKGMFVCHTCDNRRCVNPAHFFLGTTRDNLTDASQKGRLVCGENHRLSKLNEASVKEIRMAVDRGESFGSLGRKYGVSYVAIREAAKRRTWKHIA